VRWIGNEHVGRAECRERHRVRPRRALAGAGGERRQGGGADDRIVMLCGGDTERPQAASPAIVGGGLVGPRAGRVHPIAGPAIGRLGASDERERGAAQRRRGALVRFARRDDEHAGVVVGAVAVLDARLGSIGVFEQPVHVGHRHQAAEQRRRLLDHVAATTAVESTASHSAWYWRATVGQPSDGASSRALVVIASSTPGSHSAVRIAAARATGSRWGTTMPAPSDSSSTA
jgi:hypothetical protein